MELSSLTKKTKNNRKINVAGSYITIDEFLEEAYNLCQADEKIKRLNKIKDTHNESPLNKGG